MVINVNSVQNLKSKSERVVRSKDNGRKDDM